MRHSVHSIFFDQADALEQQERYDQALTLLYQVHRWAPEDPALWERLGVLSFLMTERAWLARHGHEGGHLADMGAVNADLYLRRAVELAPEQARYRFWRGWVRHALYQDPAGARASLSEALALEPAHAYAHAALGRIAMAEGADGGAPGWAEKAIGHLEAAIAQLPESGRFRYDLGACYARLGRNAEARAAFHAAMSQPEWRGAADTPGRYLAREFHGAPGEIREWVTRLYGDVMG